VLIVDGTYTYLQRIAKSVLVMHDLNQLVNLSTMGSWESPSILRLRVEGDHVFNNVSFYYPTNPDVSVLNKMSMRIARVALNAVSRPWHRCSRVLVLDR